MAATSEIYNQKLRQLSAMSNLPPIDWDSFEEYLQERKAMLRKREREHNVWKYNFEKSKQLVMARVSELTRRRKQRIQHLEQVLEEAYSRFVHNRNTTDNEKTVERVILSREASREGLLSSRLTIRGQDDTITEEQEVALPQQEVAQRQEVVLEQYPFRSEQLRANSAALLLSKPSTGTSRSVTRSRSDMPPVVRSTRTSRDRHLGSREFPRL